MCFDAINASQSRTQAQGPKPKPGSQAELSRAVGGSSGSVPMARSPICTDLQEENRRGTGSFCSGWVTQNSALELDLTLAEDMMARCEACSEGTMGLKGSSNIQHGCSPPNF